MVLLIVIILLFAGYVSLIAYYTVSWKRIPLFTGSVSRPVKASIVIAARNEEANIGVLLTALEAQTYPRSLFEVIVIDDHSTDATAAVVKRFPDVRLLQLREDAINSYKKKALAKGIDAATGELIVTTDADCIPPRDWLQTLIAFREKTGAVFIAAPVAMKAGTSVLGLFQALDFMVLQGVTGASVFRKHLSMSNGANLAYDRSVFTEAGGFDGIDHIASGDDMLLMYKISKLYPDRVHYLKSPAAIMETEPMMTWKAFWNQRIRWASKATQYNDPRIFPVLLLVYLINLCFPVLLIAGMFRPVYFLYLAILLTAKTLIEYPFFSALNRFFQRRYGLLLFAAFQPLHIMYTIISGFLGQFGKYEWKNRKVK